MARAFSTLLILWFAVCQVACGQNPHPATAAAEQVGQSWWQERHQAVLEEVRNQPAAPLLLLIGDSITNNYDKAHPPDEDFQPTWKQFYEPRAALNLGFSGDTTANVLWRLAHGEVAGLHPKVAVLLIGTNNTGSNQSSEETEVGIDAVVVDLEKRLPQTHILLLGILPSDVSTNKTERDRAINKYLAASYGENPQVTYLDIGSIFYKNGALRTDLFYDPRLPVHNKALHPDTHGQRMMAEAIEPTLAKLMGDAPQQPLDSMTDINTALIPVDKLEQDSYDWYARHHAELALAKQTKPRVVLVGDSITHFWGGSPAAEEVNGPQAWQHLFGSSSVMNMGFGWDRTQNVLWRIRQGEFDGLHPEWVVLAIGTNNLTGTSHARANTPLEIAEAIETIYRELHERSPESRIIVMGIFPRGPKPNTPFRAQIQETNRLLSQRFSGEKTVIYLDIGEQFLAPDGTLPPSLMPDALHPSDAGYEIWAQALIHAGLVAGEGK